MPGELHRSSNLQKYYLSLQQEGSNISNIYTPSSHGQIRHKRGDKNYTASGYNKQRLPVSSMAYPNTQPHSLNRKNNNILNIRSSPFRQKVNGGMTTSTENSVNNLKNIENHNQSLQIHILARKLQLSRKKRRNSTQQYQR